MKKICVVKTRFLVFIFLISLFFSLECFSDAGNFTGSWVSDEQFGHGFLLEVIIDETTIVSEKRLIVYWFKYDDLGNQSWVYGSGILRDNSADIVVYSTDGASFPDFNSEDVIQNRYGDLKFNFDSCNSGSVAYDFDQQQVSGVLSIQRLTVISGLTCEYVDQNIDSVNSPKIEFSFVPPYGSFSNLEGRVLNVNPNNYSVAIFIRVGNGWWTKPYWNLPSSPLNSLGEFKVDIVTGGQDQLANAIIAYVISKDYSPPLMSGGRDLPNELDSNSIAKLQVTRSP